MKRMAWAGLLAIAMLAIAAPARADGFLGGGIGSFTGGSLGSSTRALTVEFGAASHKGWIGVQGDFGYSTSLVAGGHSRTLTASVLVGPKLRGAVRVFGSVGAGVLGAMNSAGDIFKVTGDSPPQRNMLTIGGGVMGLISTHLGIQADVRAYRDFQAASSTDPTHVHFWRFTVGVFLGF